MSGNASAAPVAPGAGPLVENGAREDMNIVIAGHVDHGKSTVIGRLLADTGSLPEGKLAFVQEMCRRNAKPFEYAFLVDALKDERAQGITIDTSRCFFRTAKRRYLIHDAPGHIEFLKNMITGASRAEAALLVIDAAEGVQENSRRHAYMLKMLGIKQVAVLINKMDLRDYDESAFRRLTEEYEAFLKQIGIEPQAFIPISGTHGDNIAEASARMDWYHGGTVLQMLDDFSAEGPSEERPFRLPVQGVYKFTQCGDTRRIVAGTIEAGSVRVGDEVVFYPSVKKSRVASIEVFNRPPQFASEAGYAVGLTLSEQIFVRRGDMAALTGQPQPRVTSRVRANLFWLGREPMIPEKKYMLKLGTDRAEVRLEKISQIIDASTLATVEKEEIGRHDVAECILRLEKVIAFDLAAEAAHTSRFVVVDDYEIAGGGIILEDLPDAQAQVRQKVQLRNYKWEKSSIPSEERTERYSQRAALVLITGERSIDKKTVARALEQVLFAGGRLVYFLGIGNVLYGVDADLKQDGASHREEHLRRLAEVSHILLDAGIILIVTAVELTQDDLETIKTVVNGEQIETIWVGDRITTDIRHDLHLFAAQSSEQAVHAIKRLLQDRGVIFKSW